MNKVESPLIDKSELENRRLPDARYQINIITNAERLKRRIVFEQK